MRLTRVLVAVAAMLAVGGLCAQEAISFGGMTVARIREKGPYDSLAARVSQVEKWVADVISYENTKTPKLSLARKDGVLYVWCGKRQVIDIYPADAAATNMTELALGQMWMKNIREALPRSTPVSKGGGAAAAGGATAPTAPSVPASAGSGTPPVVAQTPGGEPSTGLGETAPGASTQPSGETAPPPAIDDPLPAPQKTPRSAALLMVLETMNMVRVLPEDEYLAGRDGLASNLLENLEPFMATVRESGEASGTPQPPRPPLDTTPPVGPTTPTVTPPTTPTVTPPAEDGSTPLPPALGTGGSVVPRVPTVPTAPSTPSTGTVKPPTPPTVTGDPNTARVPQKQRIKRKFAAAQEPFWALKNAGDPKADQVSQLLSESRSASTAGDFDTSEAKVDEALRLMGVAIPD